MSAFPSLFRPEPGSGRQDLRRRGFKCGEGWYPLIKGVLGRAELIGREDGLSLRVRAVMRVQGHLQIHITGANGRLWEVKKYANHVSGFICEVCGGPSQVVNRGGQLTTRCPLCLLRPDTPAHWRNDPPIPLIGERDDAKNSPVRSAQRRELATVGALVAKLQKYDANLPVIISGHIFEPDRAIDCLQRILPPMLRQPDGKFSRRLTAAEYDGDQAVRIQSVQDPRD